jgi:hypothetical protein
MLQILQIKLATTPPPFSAKLVAIHRFLSDLTLL